MVRIVEQDPIRDYCSTETWFVVVVVALHVPSNNFHTIVTKDEAFMTGPLKSTENNTRGLLKVYHDKMIQLMLANFSGASPTRLHRAIARTVLSSS
jgi:hypothetical protein